jgi:hypothetical protein
MPQRIASKRAIVPTFSSDPFYLHRKQRNGVRQCSNMARRAAVLERLLKAEFRLSR